MPAEETGTQVQHPSPHRGAVSAAVLTFAILAGPLAWALEVLLNYGLSSQACYPRQYPRPVLPGEWNWLPSFLVISTVVALIVAVVAGYLGYRAWRHTQEEASGGHRHLIEVGEGRTRFLASWGLWIGALFAVAIIFDAIGILAVRTCGG